MSLRPRHRFQYTIVVQGAAIFVAVMGAMIALALWHGGGHWPNQPPPSAQIRAALPPSLQQYIPSPPSAEERWETFLTIELAALCLWTKAWGMFRRSPRRDALVTSIILVNLAFVWVYWFALGNTVYPLWFTDIWWRRAVRWPIIATALWATIQASKLPDPSASPDYVVELEGLIDLQNAQIARDQIHMTALEAHIRALTLAQPTALEGGTL